MRYIYITLCLMLAVHIVTAQDGTYKVPMSSGELYISNVNGVVVEAYEGDEIIIDSEDNKYSKCGKKNSRKNCCENKNNRQSDCCTNTKNKKREGLRVLNNGGISDNTGLGLQVETKGKRVTIKQVSDLMSCKDVTIKLPINVRLKYKNSNINSCDLVIKDVSSEIEVSQDYSDIEMSNVTGPMSVKCVYGDITAGFVKVSQLGAISLRSTYGDVDMSMPARTKSTLHLKTSYGDIYSDMDIQFTDTPKGKWFGSTIKGKTNKGGVDITLRSGYGDVYLRKP